MTYNNYSTFFGNNIPTLSKKVDKTVTKTTTISTTTETTPVAKTTAHTNSDFNILFCRDFKTDVLTEKNLSLRERTNNNFVFLPFHMFTLKG